jgi:phenol 2-monooxygenase (NADPH)
MPSDGSFRLVVFAGDISSPMQREAVNRLGEWLATSLLPNYPTIKLSPGSNPHAGTVKFKTEGYTSVLNVLLVHSAPREDVEPLRDLHEVYHPFDAKLGWDYDTIFVDGESYHEGHSRAYEKYGIDKSTGALVGVRPDGYIGLVTSVSDEGGTEVKSWLDGILKAV